MVAQLWSQRRFGVETQPLSTCWYLVLSEFWNICRRWRNGLPESWCRIVCRLCFFLVLWPFANPKSLWGNDPCSLFCKILLLQVLWQFFPNIAKGHLKTVLRKTYFPHSSTSLTRCWFPSIVLFLSSPEIPQKKKTFFSTPHISCVSFHIPIFSLFSFRKT